MADQAAEGEGAGDQQPEDRGVEEGVDGEAGPDGAKGEGFGPRTYSARRGKAVLIRTAIQRPSSDDYDVIR